MPIGPIESFEYGNELLFDADYTKRYQATDWDIGTSGDPDSLFDWTYSYFIRQPKPDFSSRPDRTLDCVTWSLCWEESQRTDEFHVGRGVGHVGRI